MSAVENEAKRKRDSFELHDSDLEGSVRAFYEALGDAELGAAAVETMSVELLNKDIALLHGMPLALQQALCDAVLQYKRPASDDPHFFDAHNEVTRNTEMLHLGKHFVGGKLRTLGEIPSLIREVAARAHARAAERGLTVPAAAVDVAVVNAYRQAARLGLHADRESGKDAAIPVIAISLGESAEFVYKRSWKRSVPLQRLLLRSGSVLVFGGKARAMVHGVEGLVPGTTPADLRLGAPGWRRLCITCREH